MYLILVGSYLLVFLVADQLVNSPRRLPNKIGNSASIKDSKNVVNKSVAAATATATVSEATPKSTVRTRPVGAQTGSVTDSDSVATPDVITALASETAAAIESQIKALQLSDSTEFGKDSAASVSSVNSPTVKQAPPSDTNLTNPWERRVQQTSIMPGSPRVLSARGSVRGRTDKPGTPKLTPAVQTAVGNSGAATEVRSSRPSTRATTPSSEQRVSRTDTGLRQGIKNVR